MQVVIVGTVAQAQGSSLGLDAYTQDLGQLASLTSAVLSRRAFPPGSGIVAGSIHAFDGLGTVPISSVNEVSGAHYFGMGQTWTPLWPWPWPSMTGQ